VLESDVDVDDDADLVASPHSVSLSAPSLTCVLAGSGSDGAVASGANASGTQVLFTNAALTLYKDCGGEVNEV
jgi:hypothetical protein